MWVISLTPPPPLSLSFSLLLPNYIMILSVSWCMSRAERPLWGFFLRRSIHFYLFSLFIRTRRALWYTHNGSSFHPKLSQYIAAPLGSILAPFLIGVHAWTPNIHVYHHNIEALTYRCKLKLIAPLWMQTCFWGARLRPKGCWYCDILGVQTCIYLYFLVCITCFYLYRFMSKQKDANTISAPFKFSEESIKTPMTRQFDFDRETISHKNCQVMPT